MQDGNNKMAGSKMGIEMIPREVKHYEMKKEGGNQ
jgi:hypothetical protein